MNINFFQSPYAKPQLLPGRPEKCGTKRRLFVRDNLEIDEGTTNESLKLEVENVEPVENEISFQNDSLPNKDNSAQTLFRKLQEQDSSFKLLNSWLRAPISCNNKKGLNFVKHAGREGKNHIDLVCLKEIIVSQKTTFIRKICGNIIDPEKLRISEKMTSIENVKKYYFYLL